MKENPNFAMFAPLPEKVTAMSFDLFVWSTSKRLSWSVVSKPRPA
jgi:hypothetical protein